MIFESNFFNDIQIHNYLWSLNQSFNNIPLIIAASKGYQKIFNHLLSQPNIDINCKDIVIYHFSYNYN